MSPVVLVAGSVLLVVGSVSTAVLAARIVEDRRRRRAWQFTHWDNPDALAQRPPLPTAGGVTFTYNSPQVRREGGP